ncbi:solute carrier family 22 member 14 isoform X1 [Callorhinus ursinus]|uniref:Solute carrier family 22 member 14 isoform X1 n=1 Tax=Callorhinus ursinus TaxID=34884 RepID=A0A3Q7NZU3_CALUR|nr:solute carrier family 22 member 14 isoform X1 [Callorhinus ursinus]
MRRLWKEQAALTGNVSSQVATESNRGKVKRRSHYPSTKLNQLEAPEHTQSPSLEMLLRRLRATEAQQDDKFANILDVVGEFGTFQKRLVALTFIPNILLAFFMFADIFVFTAQKPYCNTSWILAVDPSLSEAQQLNLTLPREPNGSFQTCLMYLPVAWDLESIIQFGLNYTESCQDGWIYPETKKRSLVNEFDLVCGKDRDTEGVQTMLTAGLLIASLIFGFVSDKLGRYPTILMSLLGLAIFGFGAAFVNSFHQYLFFRFGVSQALVGYAISSLCLATEWLMGQHRAHAIILEHCFFSVGILFLTGLAYSLPHWRLLFLVGGAPVFLLISYIWIVPESPRWLLMKGKLEDAKQVLCYAASVNKKVIPLSLLDKLQLPGKKVTKASVLDYYNNKHFLKVTLVMGCVCFTVGYSYFTLSLKLKNLGVDLHFTQVILGIMEVPACLCCIFLLEQMGRKWSLIATLFQGSLMCLLVLILPSELKSMIILMVVLGEFSLAASVSVFFIYTAELLPTVLRATGLGLVSLAWAGGAISSLAVSHQKLTLLPIFLCCISAALALFLCSLLPETQDRALPDNPEHCFLQTKNMAEDPFTEEVVSGDGTAEVMKNTILNSTMLKSDLDIHLGRTHLCMARERKETHGMTEPQAPR